ncbi:hypothetical protein [Haloferula sp. A504]|uniref:hypothetical protein n=1 Tax=Haloferula sp. A504 TaxID=3373601 RepID=UPI0031C22158|nr:hypothetical protein [Verrucomicrobiaceae bacterium E54]
MKLPLHCLITLAALSLWSCTGIDGEYTSSADFEEGVPGGKFSETTTITATVTGIDAETRKITFVTPKGRKFTSTAGPEVLNFDQIRLGDQLTATLTDEVVIRMARPDERVEEFLELDADLAKAGDKPGMETVTTSQMVATITSLSTRQRKVTLAFPDGDTQRVKVRPDVHLDQFQKGDRVVIQLTEIFAISLKKP